MMSNVDLTAYLKEASIPDLSWLDVDEAEYRAHDMLPKQNLDVVPDLQMLWAHSDSADSGRFVPNRSPVNTPGVYEPRTMGDLSQVHGLLRTTPPDLRRTARMAMMQSDDLGRLRNELVGRYGMSSLQEQREVLASVLMERGLLGRLYIDSRDFPNCATSRKPGEFTSKYASGAKFLLAKKACGGCSHSTPTASGGHVCGQFQKQLVVDVPVTPQLAEAVEEQQRARGRAVQASYDGDLTERIRRAYLAAPVARQDPNYGGVGVDYRPQSNMTTREAATQLVAASSLVRRKGARDKTAMDAEPVLTFLHREMVKGLTQKELASSLRMAFDRDLLARTTEHWAPLFRESGLYGVVFTRQASFDDCHVGADFLAKHNPGVRAVVAGAKCGSCIYNKTRCLLYGKPLVRTAAEVLTPETVDAVLLEHRTAGRLPAWETRTAAAWGTPAEALKRIHEVTSVSTVQTVPERLVRQQGFYGSQQREMTLRRELGPIAKQAQRYMNEGLYGRDLAGLLRSKYAAVDIIAAKDELRTVLAEQGLQGVHYVDPTIYDDYGTCDEASRLHGTRMVPYLKRGSKCSGCVNQVKLGFCSKIRKPLVTEPPYTNKRAQQRAVLASGRTDVVAYESLVNNGASMLSEFQMQNQLQVDVDATLAPTRDVSIMFGTAKVKL